MLYTRPPTVEVAGSPSEGLEARRPLVVPVVKKEGKPVIEGFVADVDSSLGGVLSRAVDAGLFKGDVGEIYVVPGKAGPVYFVGVGEAGNEDVRKGLAKVAKQLVEKFEEAFIALDVLPEAVRGEALLGFLLGSYRLEAFKSEKKAKLSRILVSGVSGEEAARIIAVAEGVYLARDVANAPPNDLYPERLAEKVKELFAELKNVEVEIFDYERLVREGFGGLVNVGKGSVHKPVLIKLHYKGGGKKVAVVGKTIVFDTGGIQLKQPHMMFTMYADKAGGAAVLGIVWAAAKLGLKLDLYGLLSAAINAPSGEAYLPSDVIRMWDGTMVDVGHTDAEGRLAIADAIAYAAKEIGADIVIDLATLTGAAVVALGPLIAALFTRDDGLAKLFEEASKQTGELLWRMPMADVYKSLLVRQARLGDTSNVGGRWAGAIIGALFLERFSHGKKFVHLDIAGPGIGGWDVASIAPDYWPGKHAPGYGVRLVLEVLRGLEGEGETQ